MLLSGTFVSFMAGLGEKNQVYTVHFALHNAPQTSLIWFNKVDNMH
jgi:hypothetical protein